MVVSAADPRREPASPLRLPAGLVRHRPDSALGFLATPTDVFAVPRDAVEHSTRAYREPSRGMFGEEKEQDGAHAETAVAQ